MRTFCTTSVFFVLAAGLLAGCGGTSNTSAGGGGGKIALVAYSTPKEAYEELIPKFGETEGGKGTSFSQSYGASGDQARAVISGLPTDVVALSLAPDVDKLVEEDLVAKDWANDEFGGNVTRSVVVLAVRKGNPKGIKGWSDLIKPGVEVITPNPFTSGGARWNVMAAYGAQLQQGKSAQQAEAYLKDLFDNVSVQDKSAREALQTFTGGKGDVLIAYENEAITAQQKGQDVDYVIPDETILIENPIAPVKGGPNPEGARAFIEYVRSPDAQEVFADKGYRSVRDDLVDASTYPEPAKPFTIRDLGGWPKVSKDFFDPDESIVAEIERGLGVSTSK